MLIEVLLKAGWISVSAFATLMLVRYTRQSNNPHIPVTFSPFQQYLSEVGGSTSASRPYFVAWGLAYALLASVSFAILLKPLHPVALVLPFLLLALFSVGFIAPLDTQPTIHNVAILGGIGTVGLCIYAAAVALGSSPGNLAFAVTVLLSAGMYLSFELTQLDEGARSLGVDPQHLNGPPLQKLFLSVVFVSQFWLVYQVGAKNWGGDM